MDTTGQPISDASFCCCLAVCFKRSGYLIGETATMETLAQGIFLAVVNEKLIEYLTEPIRRRYEHVDFWWLLYVALVTGAAIGWLAEVNFFETLIVNEIVGRVLSSILVGGGSSLIHDIFKEK